MKFTTIFGLLAAMLLGLLSGCAVQTTPPVKPEVIGTPSPKEVEPGRTGTVEPPQPAAVQALRTAAEKAQAGGDGPRAISLLERALRIAPADPGILQQMAETHLQAGNDRQALHFATRAFESGSRNGGLCGRSWRTIAAAQDRLGDQVASAQAKQRARACRDKSGLGD